jgi:multimeric flavodoxin WrbA
MDLKPCDGCLACRKTGECHIKDDMDKVYEQLLKADGMIWATPVYFDSVTAQAKTVIDRTYVFVGNSQLADKIGGVISTATSVGHLGVWSVFQAFFHGHRMHLADFVYGYAREKGQITKDKHAMKAAYELGRLVALMAENPFHWPEENRSPLYRVVAKKYGISACPAEDRFEK